MVQRYEQMRRLQWYKCGAAYLECIKLGKNSAKMLVGECKIITFALEFKQ